MPEKRIFGQNNPSGNYFENFSFVQCTYHTAPIETVAAMAMMASGQFGR